MKIKYSNMFTVDREIVFSDIRTGDLFTSDYGPCLKIEPVDGYTAVELKSGKLFNLADDACVALYLGEAVLDDKKFISKRKTISE